MIIVHEEMSEELRSQLREIAEQNCLDWSSASYYPVHTYRQMVQKPLRRPGEAVDMLLGTSLNQVFEHYSTVKHGPRILLWTESQRDWREALSSIRVDPTATRSKRLEFIPCKRAGCSLQEMLRLTAWIENGAVNGQRIVFPVPPIPLTLNAQERIARLVSVGYFGKDSQECLLCGGWWIEQQGCKRISGDRGVLHNRQRASSRRETMRVTFGRLYPWAIARFLEDQRATAVAHLLHPKSKGLIEGFEFSRGPKWAAFDEIDRSVTKTFLV